MGKFTFPAMPDLEEREQMFGIGSIVNTISATPYKCTRRYGSSLGGGLAAVQQSGQTQIALSVLFYHPPLEQS